MNYFKMPPTLIGEKVTLRTINPERDQDSFFEIFLEPEMHVWTGNQIPTSKDESYQELKKYHDLDFLISWAVVMNETEEFIGTFWIAPETVDGKKIICAEAQRIGKNHWRKGYTKEARKLIYDFAFFTLGVEEIHAQAWEHNINSCLSMENAGFVLQKSEKQFFQKRNQSFYQNHYVLSKENWIKKISK